MKNELGKKIIKILSLDKKLWRLPGQQRIAKKLKTLHNGVESEKQLYRVYLSQKVTTMFWAIIGFCFAIVIICINQADNSSLTTGFILRDDYGGEEKTVHLIANSEGNEEEIVVSVEPLHYSKMQLDDFAEQLFSSLSQEVFSDNQVTGDGMYVVKNHLSLPKSIEGYPFELLWESSDYEVMDNEGNILIAKSQGPKEAVLTLNLNCYGYTWEKDYYLMVYEPYAEWKENFSDKVEAVIEELDNASAESRKLNLPSSINGHDISYKEKGENTHLVIGGLGLIILIILWILPDNNLSSAINERNKQLQADYAILVNKLALYMGAGLSLRSAVAKIAQGANKDRFYAKELEVAMRELENGLSEQAVMERMADRCRIPCYIKLSVLLNQNVKKGNNGLQKQLKEEVTKAFEERKNYAEKYGHEAGTKLLFPMILMLLVVMVMIMYPAFVSFTI